MWILVIVKTGESFLVCDGMDDYVMPVRPRRRGVPLGLLS